MSKMIAIFVIDEQNGFGHPLGGLYVKGGEQVVEPTNYLVKFGEKNKCLMLFSRDWHPGDSEHFKKWPRHCEAGTWSSLFLFGLYIPHEAIMVYKGIEKTEDGYDPMFARTLVYRDLDVERFLEEFGVKTIVFCGLATDYCVKAGVLTACLQGFKVYVVADACQAVNLNPGDEQKAIEEMKNAGATIVTTEEVLKWNI